MQTVLCINGSDSMGNAGIQADIRTIRDLGGCAVTAVTSVTIQNSKGITDIYELPSHLVAGQVRAIYEETFPDAVKVGMINAPDTIAGIRQEIVGCSKVVCSPVVLSSNGRILMSNESIWAYCQQLIPICRLLVIKCVDAEILLGQRICTEQDMRQAVSRLHHLGAVWVLLRGGTYAEGRINALLSGPEYQQFFSSVNVDGWQRHGVGGALSTAIAAQLAKGDDEVDAVTHAHHYLHSQLVYASPKPRSLQSNALYDRFMSLLSEFYSQAHEVSFYAERLAVSPRYLSQVTNGICGRSPKQIIDESLLRESEQLLSTTTLTIQQIAYRLGFSSQITFAKFFKAKKGSSPSSYRVRYEH